MVKCGWLVRTQRNPVFDATRCPRVSWIRLETAGTEHKNGCVRRRAEGIDHVWCYDFVSDQTVDG